MGPRDASCNLTASPYSPLIHHPFHQCLPVPLPRGPWSREPSALAAPPLPSPSLPPSLFSTHPAVNSLLSSLLESSLELHLTAQWPLRLSPQHRLSPPSQLFRQVLSRSVSLPFSHLGDSGVSQNIFFVHKRGVGWYPCEDVWKKWPKCPVSWDYNHKLLLSGLLEGNKYGVRLPPSIREHIRVPGTLLWTILDLCIDK